MATFGKLTEMLGKEIVPVTKGDLSWRHEQLVTLLQMCHWELEKHAGEISKLQDVILNQQSYIAAQNEILSQLQVSGTPILADKFSKRFSALAADSPYPIFNTSATRYNGQYIFCSRSVNMKLYADGFYGYVDGPHRALNYIHSCDERFSDFVVAPLDDQFLVKYCPDAKNGIEDIRLFVWRDALWGLGAGVSQDGHSCRVRQILIRIAENKIVEHYNFASPSDAFFEKNWMPVIINDDLYLVYSLQPLIVFRFNGKTLDEVKGPEGQEIKFDIRGGTPFIPYRQKYLSIVHFAPVKIGMKSFYRHAFMVMNSSLEIEDISEPFFLQRHGVEFACGLETYEDGILISYGVSDRSANYGILPSSELERWVVF